MRANKYGRHGNEEEREMRNTDLKFTRQKYSPRNTRLSEREEVKEEEEEKETEKEEKGEGEGTRRGGVGAREIG